MSAKLVSLFWTAVALLVSFIKDPLGMKARKAETDRLETLSRLRDAYDGKKAAIIAHLEHGRLNEAEDELATMRQIRRSHNEIALKDEKLLQRETMDIAHAIVAARQAFEAKLAEEAELQAQALRKAIEAAEEVRREEARRKAERVAECVRLVAYHVQCGHDVLTVKDGNISEQTVIDMAANHAERAADAHAEANQLQPNSVKYGEIKKLERAVAAAQEQLAKQLDQERREAKARETAEREAAAAAEKAEAEQREEAKRLQRKQAKADEAKARAETALQQGFTALKQGHIAQAELLAQNASAAAKEANKHLSGTCEHKMAKPLRDAIEATREARREEARKAAEAEAARQAEKAAQRAKREQTRADRKWLVSFFNTKADPNKRCAVCLAQAGRLLARLGNPADLVAQYKEMAKFLATGYERFGSPQLCDYVAEQARDEAGRQYGHRFFAYELRLVQQHVLEETGEIVELEELEQAMSDLTSHPRFAENFQRWKRCTDRRLQKKQEEHKTAVRKAVNQTFAAIKQRASQAA